MATIVRREVRKRGVIGWLFQLLFLGWNLLMVAWLVAALYGIGVEMETSAHPDATATGGTIGIMMLVIVWAAGSLIFGLLALLTRGSKVLIEETTG